MERGIQLIMQDAIESINVEELLGLLDRPDVVIVDVLGNLSYTQYHIKNSISIPFDILEKGGWEKIPKSKTVITYCHSSTCNASKRAAEIFLRNGFKVKAYEGGISEWRAKGLPAEGTTLSSEAR
jgi:rhodanese-related sulfurtransferase